MDISLEFFVQALQTQIRRIVVMPLSLVYRKMGEFSIKCREGMLSAASMQIVC